MVDKIREVGIGYMMENLLGHIKDHNFYYKFNVKPLDAWL